MKVLLTGATGFLGSEIARQLVAAGHELRVTARKTSKLDALAGLAYEKVDADINDREAILRALDGCDAVIHTAASVTMRIRDRETLYRSNVEGTRTVLTAALEKGVKRAVYTSSIATIGVSAKPALLDESTTFNAEPIGVHYVNAKKRAEEVAFELAKKGLPLVILNPGTILGPRDPYLSSTKLLLEFEIGRVGGAMDGGTSFCDVRDVAAAHVAALTRGRVGERYILAGQNFTYLEAFETTAEVAGLKKPARYPYVAAWLIGAISQLAARFVEHRFEEVNIPVIRFGSHYNYCEVRKARLDLGYAVRLFEETVRDTVADHVRRGLVEARTPQLQALKAEAAVAAQPAVAAV